MTALSPTTHPTSEGEVFNLITTVSKQNVSVLNCFYDLRLKDSTLEISNRCIYYCSALDGSTGEMHL